MLTSAYILSTNKKDSQLIFSDHGSGTMSPNAAKDVKRAVGDFIMFVIILLIIDILVIVYAVHCTLKCAKAKGWPVYVSLILIFLIFSPGIGFVVGFAMIIYCLAAGCNNPKLSFTFY